MKILTWFACLTALTLLPMACAGSGEPAAEANPSTVVEVTADLLSQGHQTYIDNCVPCHGPRGKGDGPSAASLNPRPRDHSDPELMEKLTDKRIAETVRMGGVISGFPNMPASPHLRGDELAGLVAFVRSLHREEVVSVDLEGVGQEG